MGKDAAAQSHSFGMPQKCPAPIQELQSFGTRLTKTPIPKREGQSPSFVPKGHPSTAPWQEQKDLWPCLCLGSKSCKFSKTDTEGKH